MKRRTSSTAPQRLRRCEKFGTAGGPPSPWPRRKRTELPRMANLWYHGFHRICNRVYFARVTVLHPERLPKTGPVMYLGLHRNGAVDGFIYNALLPRAVFLISTQLRRNPLGRLFFSGI